MSEPRHTLNTLTRLMIYGLLIGYCGMVDVSVAQEASTSFTINDNTGLEDGTYKIYMAGYANGLALATDGAWVNLTEPGSGWGTGSGAQLSASVKDGQVISVTVTGGGSEYQGDPAIVFSGVGRGASAKAILGPGGAIQSVKVIRHGSGYTSAPTVTVPIGGTLPCTEVKPKASGQNTTITVPANIAGGRVYFFVTRKGDKFYGKCSSPLGKWGTVGLFGTVAPDVAAFTYDSSGNIHNPITKQALKARPTMPVWAFSEIGASATTATIDVSQVDFVSFPLNITASVTQYERGWPDIKQGVGTSLDPTGHVNRTSVIESWDNFVNTLSEADQAVYNSLKRSIPNTSPQQYIIMNPGGYLGDYKPAVSGFNTAFNNLINNYLWQTKLETTKPWAGLINTGGAFSCIPTGTTSSDQCYGQPDPKNPKSIPQETFKGVASTITYPGYIPPIKAIKFTGNATGAVVYIISPTSMVAMCNSPTVKNQLNCSIPNTTGYQVFAAAGALGAPTQSMYNSLITDESLKIWQTYGGFGNYVQVAGRLAFIISTAFNRGVAGIVPRKGTSCPPGRQIGQCWNAETQWYPTSANPPDGTIYFKNDITQNQFARWIHTANEPTNQVQLYAKPLNAVKSKGGAVMAMAYGFSNDENPTPPNAGTISPEVPSKYDQNVLLGGSTECNFITFGPWASGSPNPAPTSHCANPKPSDPKCLAPSNSTIEEYTGNPPPKPPIPKDKYPPNSVMCSPGAVQVNSLKWDPGLGLFQWNCQVIGADHPTASCQSAP